MATTASIMPDPYRKWVKGTEYIEPADECTTDGTIVGVGTAERVTFGRACGVTFASPLPPKDNEFDEEFWEEYLAH
jgi:hypothetical protein